MKVEPGDKVAWKNKEYKVLGFSTEKDSYGRPLVVISWDSYDISPTGYVAVPQFELRRHYDYGEKL